MSIVPLPVFEADADAKHRDALTIEEQHAQLSPPETLVVRFGALRWVGEYAYEGDLSPGCGTKLVARTHRGTELVEMLTTTCSNAGCGKSLTRKEMLQYIDQSGGKDYPFYTKGKVLRVATVEDLNQQSKLNGNKTALLSTCRADVKKFNLDMKIVDVEPILGQEIMTFYYMSEDRVDFRELVRGLASHVKARVEMRQVGARDEARLVADYERCGQHCCCQNFLKVLKPVSMRSAKVQKATLDPLKISGRCGRLMCCLRYEDQTYKELKSKLPHRKTRVGTPEGPGIVLDSKVLVQLVLVELEEDRRQIAVPVEALMDPDACPKPGAAKPDDPLRGLSEEEASKRSGREPGQKRRGRGNRGSAGKQGDGSNPPKKHKGPAAEGEAAQGSTKDSSTESSEKPKRKRKRRRRRRPGGGSNKPSEGNA
jgi:cell fate regulator YaaT (PSP1 superfamily)